jgi:hypothetical protein
MSKQQTSAVTTDLTNDPRVQEIAEFTGASPEDVVATATQAAAEYGDTVSQELDTGVEIVEIVASMAGSDDDGTDGLSTDDDF